MTYYRSLSVLLAGIVLVLGGAGSGNALVALGGALVGLLGARVFARSLKSIDS